MDSTRIFKVQTGWAVCCLNITYELSFIGLFVSESDTQIRVLLLFAIYVLYASQPYQEEAIRKPIAVSWDTFSTMKVFYRDVLLTGSSGSYRDAAQIFYHRLLRRNAFQLHLTMPASTSTTAMPMAKGMIDMDSLGGAAVRVQSLAHTPTLDDLTEVQQREAAYEELLAQFMPALEGQHRPHFVTHLQLCESPSRTRAKKTGKKARSKSMERQRAASASAIPPPQRPSTAPPFGRPRSASGGDFLATENNARLGVRPEPNSRSVSPLDYLAMDVDMPDFSSFLQ